MPVLPLASPALSDLRQICRRWFPEAAVDLEPLTGPGFSGSPLYLVRAGREQHVLKAFAGGSSLGRVRFVQALVRHLRDRGVSEVPALRAAVAGERFVVDAAGRVWEMQAFVPGRETADPTMPQVMAAIAAVGRLHAAAASMPENPPDVGPSPGIARRIAQARGWLLRPWELVLEAVPPAAVESGLAARLRPRFAEAAATLRQARAERILAAIAAAEPGPLVRQTVLRDIWSAHVLFPTAGQPRVAGIVDLHAAGADTPATDLGRLLGSWMTARSAEPDWWRRRLAAYDGTEPDEAFTRLVMFLAASGTLFGLDNWLRWVFEEGREFGDVRAVVTRVDRLVSVLPTALEILAAVPDPPGLTLENCSL